MPVIFQRNAAGTRSAWPGSRGKSRLLRFFSGRVGDGRTLWNSRWCKEKISNDPKVMAAGIFRWLRRMSRAAAVKIRWDRSHGEGDAFWFSEQRNQDDRGDNRGLRSDGNDQRAAANAALTFTLLGTAFDETALQGAEIILRTGAGFDRHHTPPQKSSASENRNFCDAGFLRVAQLPQETGAALAGM